MRILLLLLLLASSLLAWDCSEAKNESDLRDDTFCRKYSTIYTITTYDSVSIRSGFHVSTTKESEAVPVLLMFAEEAEQCYQTCMLAHMY